MTTTDRQTSRTLALSGKVALVSGGSRGIGAGIVRRLAHDGAAVAFTYAGGEEPARALVAAVAEQGGRALAVRADSADASAVERSVAQTVEAFGGLDILVNNAAIMLGGQLTEVAPADLDRMLAVNVRAPVIATQAALRHMHAGGRIINIGSVNSEFVPFAGASIYALTKGAISGFTHGLARELGARGITINNVQPGPVDTDMNPADGAFSKQLTGLIAVQRYGQVHEVAGLVAYLVSPEGAYVTGADLKVDGGFTA
jgi:3-oxoacyl-[acyl-carrier protein] reductase